MDECKINGTNALMRYQLSWLIYCCGVILFSSFVIESVAYAENLSAVNNTTITIATPVETIKDAAEEALRNNPALLASQANYDIAKQQLRQAQGQLLPTVNATYSYGRQGSFNTTTQAAGYTDYRYLTDRLANVTATQLLFDAGNTLNQVRQARANVVSNLQTFINARQALLLSVVNVYAQILQLKELDTTYQGSLAVYQDVLTKTERNFKAGAGERSEISLAKSRVIQTQAEMDDLHGQQQVARAQFVQVVGSVPRHLVGIDAPSYKIPATLEQAENIGLRNNAALKAAWAQVVSARYALASVKASFYPVLNANATADRDLNISGSPGSANQQQVYVQMTYNIFNGGSNQANLRATALRMQQALDQYDDTKRTVLENIRAGWDTYQAIKMRLPELAETVVQEQFTTYAYRKQYLIGRRTLLDLVTVEGSLFRAQTLLINGRYALVTSAYSLLAAMGEIEEPKV